MSAEGLSAAVVLAERYAQVVASLTSQEWSRPSRCAGWSVQDLVAHTGSNFKVLVEPPEASDPAEGGSPVTAEQAQELLVLERRGWTAAEVAAEFERYREPALAALAAVQEEPTASAPVTLSDLGTYPMQALADAFAFDLWCHLYVDLLAPAGPVERPPVEHDDAILRPGVGWMLQGLPQMCPGVVKVLDRPLGLRLTGPGGGDWTLRSDVEQLVVEPGIEPGISGPPATVASTARDFVLWGTTRTAWQSQVSISGDQDFAERVLNEINIV